MEEEDEENVYIRE